MGLTRRHFLRLSGVGFVASACGPVRTALPSAEVALRGLPARSASEPLLVVVFLRGGADGLHLAPPLGDPSYTDLRGELALSQAHPFVTGFGLHPALEPVLPLVERRELAVVHAVGSPHPTRSHFEAQDLMELGAPDTLRPSDGWLARALRAETEGDPFAALALASRLPLSLRGAGSFAVGDADAFGIPAASPDARAALAALYRGAEDDPVARAGRRALAALADYEERVGRSRTRHRRTRRGPRAGLSEAADQLLALERAGLSLRAVFLESDGWDTHINQGDVSGPLATRIGDLATAVAKLSAGLDGRREPLIAVMTEFGRTVRPNGSRGSDHGHGSVMLVAGPRVRGGLYGDWKGLAESTLYEGRDLPVTTDWRAPLHEVLTAHLGAPPPEDTFPGFDPTPLGLIRST